MKVQLVVVQGKPEGMTIPLAGPRYKIGRGEACQLRPNSDLVSREHAEFSVTADSVIVQDLGSRNGTEVNGKRLAANQPQLLKSGDLIKVGTLTFAISIQGAPTAKPVSVGAGGGSRKKSLDDVSGDEIDSWLVSDESRPTPDRPSGVYGGDTVTLATYKGQEKEKSSKAAAAAPPPKPAPAAKPASPPPPPVVATPPPAPLAPPAPVAQAPELAPASPPPAQPIMQATEPAPPPPPPVVQTPAPVSAPSPQPVVQAAPAPPRKVEREEPSGFEKYFAGLPDLPEEEDTGSEAESEPLEDSATDDGIEDLSSFQDDDETGDSAGAVPEEYVDESNPFYVKKKAAEAPAAATKPGVGSQDSSAAAGDILRKLMDRRRGSKS